MKKVSVLVVLCMLFASLGDALFESVARANASSNSTEINLIKNGGFETVVTHASWTESKGAADWGVWLPKGSPKLSLEQSEDKGNVVQVTATAQSRATINQTIAVSPNKRYLLSFWVKTEEVVTPTSYGGVYARNSFLNSSNQRIDEFLMTDRQLGTNNWQHLEYEYISPPNANAFLVELFFEESLGNAWFNDIRMIDLGEAKLFSIPNEIALDEGDSYTLTPIFTPTDLSDKTIFWSSSDEEVATVDAAGEILAISDGTAVITGTLQDGGYEASITVSVQGTATLQAMKLMRDRWFEKLTGNNGYEQASTEYRSYYEELADEKVQLVANHEQSGYWDTMNKASGRTFLWNDLQHACSPSGSYSRLKEMALAYTMSGSELQGNIALKQDIIDALEWLYTHEYNETMNSKSACGWDFEIGIVQTLGDLLVLMHADLTSEQINSFVKPIDKFGDPTKFNMHNATPSEATGANRSDKALGMALRAIVAADAGKLAMASDALDKVFPYVTNGDGFYRDGSFVQHTYVAYTGSYGGVLLNGLSSMFYLLADTPWDVSAKSGHDNIYSWITDAYEPLIYNGRMMEMVYGRAISRSGTSYKAPTSHVMLFAQAATDETIKERFKRMVKEWYLADSSWEPSQITNRFELSLAEQILENDELLRRGEMTKHHVFAAMDRVVHLRPEYAIGLSMFSNRISAFEYGNGENKEGWFTGIGMTSLYTKDTTQFTDNFYNTVDMMRLPGITTDRSRATLTNWKNYPNNNRRAGGAEIDGLYGVSGMEFSLSNVTGSELQGKKSWFMFEEEVVALGSGISKPTADTHTVETIVENRKLNEEGSNTLTVNGEAVLQTTDSERLEDVNWAHLQGNVAGADIGYYFPKPQALNGLRELRTGSWRQVNDGGSDEAVSKHYLSLAIDHGEAPQNGEYAYVLLPNKSAEQTAFYGDNPQVDIISKTNQIHAVVQKELGILAANFWSAGELEQVRVDRPASIMLKKQADELTVAVADPLRDQGTMRIEIAHQGVNVLSSDPAITVQQMSPHLILEVDMDDAMGQSKTITLQIDPAAESQLPQPEVVPSVIATVAEDTYVHAGGTASDNFGGVGYLNIRNGEGAYKREVLLKFELADLDGKQIERALLHVYGRTNDGSGDQSNIAVFAVDDNTWEEHSVTFATKPEFGLELDRIVFGKNNEWRQFDVSDFILPKMNVEELNENSKVSFALVQVDSNLSAEIRSRENSAGGTAGEFASFLELFVKEEVDPGEGETDPGDGGTTAPGESETEPGEGETTSPEESEAGSGEGETTAPKDEENATASPEFNDVEQHWAATIIAEAAKLGIVKGYDDRTFRPDALVTRAQLSVMLSRALQLKTADRNEGAEKGKEFQDAAAIPAWAKSEVNHIVSMGIIEGYPNGTFRPNLEVSRTELAVMIVRALQLPLSAETKLTFNDQAQIAAWAKPYIAAVVQAGIMEGRGGNLFAPSQTATRAEAVKLIMTVVESN